LTSYTFNSTTGNYSAITILHTLRFTVTYALGFSAFTSRILATDLSQSHLKLHMKSCCQRSNFFLPLPSPELDPFRSTTVLSRLLFSIPLSQSESEPESESQLFYERQFISATNPLKLTSSSFFQLNTCSHSAYVTSCLRRGWVCRLQSLLTLARAVILRSESRRDHGHTLLSQIRDSPKLMGQVPLFIFPRKGWLTYTPMHWVPFPSPPTTRRAMVGVFDPASTRWNSIPLSSDCALLQPLGMDPTGNSIFSCQGVCLLVRYLAMDVLLSHAHMLWECIYRVVA
jgi:hypothetical protein